VVLLAFVMVAGVVLKKRAAGELKGVIAAALVLALSAFFDDHRFLLRCRC